MSVWQVGDSSRRRHTRWPRDWSSDVCSSDLSERGLAMGIYGIAAMIAPAIGPTVGGIVIEFFTWPFLFLFNIPFATAGLIFSAKYLIPTEKEDRKSVV